MSIHLSEYIALDSFCNVYSYCRFLYKGFDLVMIATKTKVFLMQMRYTDPRYLSEIGRSSAAQEIHLSQIPKDSHLIAIDAYTIGSGDGTPIIGLTFVHRFRGTDKFFFNIYGLKCPSTARLSAVFQDCLQLQLSYIPFGIFHNALLSPKKEMDFIVSGNDRVHVYRWFHDLSFSEVTGHEHPFRDLFGSQLATGVLCMDARADGKGGVLVALGCQDGAVALGSFPNPSVSVVSSPSAVATWTHYQMDGPVSCLSLFCVAVSASSVAPSSSSSDSRMSPAVIQGVQARAAAAVASAQVEGDEVNPKGAHQIHLVVGAALGYVAFFTDVINCGFDKESYLPHSDEYDSIMCVASVDLDLHGRHQLLLGTFNQRVLIYQTNSEQEVSYELVSTLEFDHPVFAIDSADLSRNGLEELIVTTMYSVQVFEQDMEAVLSKLRMKEELLSEIIGLEKTFSFLSSVAPESTRSSLSSPVSFVGPYISTPHPQSNFSSPSLSSQSSSSNLTNNNNNTTKIKSPTISSATTPKTVTLSLPAALTTKTAAPKSANSSPNTTPTKPPLPAPTKTITPTKTAKAPTPNTKQLVDLDSAA